MHPILLTGAALVGLPILLHLIMRQEPKRLPFPAFRFLKETARTNQRKLRLRHWVLLALRMLLIALMALALFQPTVFSEQFPLRGDSPVAAALVLDTSPSMGLLSGERSRLDEAKARALELLSELPADSPVVVIDTGESPGGLRWLDGPAEARRLVEAIARPKAANRPVTAAVDQAYRLFGVLDRERGGDPESALPRLLAVFSDRTASSWPADRLADLIAQRDRVPPPAVRGLWVDVGTDKPANVAITAARAEPAVVPANQPVVIAVTVAATGAAAETVVACRVNGERSAEQLPVKLAAGESTTVRFRRTDLKPGLHQAELTLATPDALPGDNVRFATFAVRAPRLVLALSDLPEDAIFWKLALESGKLFSVEAKTPAEVADWKPEQWNRYEAVGMLNVSAPGSPPERPLWTALDAYVNRGGTLMVFPGGDELRVADYAGPPALRLLPGKPVALVAADAKTGVGWMWNSLDARRPLLAPFREWQQQPGIDFVRFPPRAFRYWRVEPVNKDSTLVSYTDKEQSPALLEREVGRGKVVQFTTPWDARRDANDQPWNDYLQTSFYVVLSNQTAKYLLGDTAQRSFDFGTGQSVTVPIPLSVPGTPGQTFLLDGPGIGGAEAVLKRTEATPDRLVIDRERTRTPGNFRVSLESRAVLDGYSLNPDAAESDLGRVPPAEVESVLGEGAVLAADRKFDLRQLLEGKFTQPVELFPWLMIGLLFFIAIENLLANRFYRERRRV